MNQIKQISTYASAICLFVFPFVMKAQSVTIHSLDEALELSKAKNVDYQNYVLNQKQAELEYKQAKKYKLPTVSYTFSSQRNIDLATTPLPGEIFGEPGTTVNAQFGQEYTYNTGISISKELINREARLQSKISQLSMQIENVEKEAFEDLLTEQVSIYYYTGLVAKRAVQLGEKDLESAEQISLLTKDRYDNGIVDAITMNSSSINVNAVKQNLNASKQLMHQCSTELKKLFGMELVDELTLSDSLSYDFNLLAEQPQLKTNPLITTTALQYDQAELQLKKSKSMRLPSLSMNSYYGRQQFQDQFELGFISGDWSANSYVSFNLSIPIFTGFNNQSTIKQSKLNQQISFNNKRDTELRAALDDELMIAEYNYSLNEAMATKDAYLLYEENQELTYQKYEEGLISLDNYLSVFEEYLKAENSYLNALSKVYTNYSQIIPRVQ